MTAREESESYSRTTTTLKENVKTVDLKEIDALETNKKSAQFIKRNVLRPDSICALKFTVFGLLLSSCLFLVFLLYVTMFNCADKFLQPNLQFFTILYTLLSLVLGYKLFCRLFNTNLFNSYLMFTLFNNIFVMIESTMLTYYFLNRFTPSNTKFTWQIVTFYGVSLSRIMSFISITILLYSTTLVKIDIDSFNKC